MGREELVKRMQMQQVCEDLLLLCAPCLSFVIVSFQLSQSSAVRHVPCHKHVMQLLVVRSITTHLPFFASRHRGPRRSRRPPRSKSQS